MVSLDMVRYSAFAVNNTVSIVALQLIKFYAFKGVRVYF